MIQYTIIIENTQTVNGNAYTQEQLAQGLSQVRTQHNQRTGQSLTDAQWLQWSSLQNLAAWYEQNKAVAPVTPSPVVPVADWLGLRNELAGGSLNSIFKRLTIASLSSDANTISTARGDITDAIITIKEEAFLKSGLDLLIEVAGYQFTPEEKTLWNAKVIELNFSNLVQIG